MDEERKLTAEHCGTTHVDGRRGLLDLLLLFLHLLGGVPAPAAPPAATASSAAPAHGHVLQLRHARTEELVHVLVPDVPDEGRDLVGVRLAAGRRDDGGDVVGGPGFPAELAEEEGGHFLHDGGFVLCVGSRLLRGGDGGVREESVERGGARRRRVRSSIGAVRRRSRLCSRLSASTQPAATAENTVPRATKIEIAVAAVAGSNNPPEFKWPDTTIDR